MAVPASNENGTVAGCQPVLSQAPVVHEKGDIPGFEMINDDGRLTFSATSACSTCILECVFPQA